MTPSDGTGGGAGEGTYEAPRLQEARSSEPRLRIVYSRDTQEGPREMNSRPPTQGRLNSHDASAAMLDRSLQCKIGSMLRDVFSGVEQEQLPPRLEELLRAMKAMENSQ